PPPWRARRSGLADPRHPAGGRGRHTRHASTSFLLIPARVAFVPATTRSCAVCATNWSSLGAYQPLLPCLGQVAHHEEGDLADLRRPSASSYSLGGDRQSHLAPIRSSGPLPPRWIEAGLQGPSIQRSRAATALPFRSGSCASDTSRG